jgi:quercetin dioxygenase-like cupin family protein
MGHTARIRALGLSRIVAIGATLVMATASITVAGLEAGELPDEGFSHTSTVDHRIGPSGFAAADSLADIYQELAHPSATGFEAADSLTDIYQALADADRAARGDIGAGLDLAGPLAVETTYTLRSADPGYRFGWHVNDGPVIVTVTSGTLTFVDATCRTFDLVAGHTYIEPTGEVLDAVLVPEKNLGVESVGWFTTRLHPAGVAAPLEVEAPCAM